MYIHTGQMIVYPLGSGLSCRMHHGGLTTGTRILAQNGSPFILGVYHYAVNLPNITNSGTLTSQGLYRDGWGYLASFGHNGGFYWNSSRLSMEVIGGIILVLQFEIV